MTTKDENRVAIITGGGTGVGAATALALDEHGWSVVICGRRPELLEAVGGQLQNPYLAIALDVSQPEDVEKLFSTTIETFGRVDLLFNNAGIGAPPVPIDDLPVSSWLEVVQINLTATWLCSRAAFRQMKNQMPPGGRIINNGSVSAQTPRPFSSPYTATKHAVTGLTKSLSLEGRDCGITVGQIDIGNALTPLTGQISEGALQADGTIRGEPTMDVEHVAEAIVLLAQLPNDVNVPQMTIMANEMPLIGRG
jgi:NAD(P)-dependent dehydrogenase (short-subunit alcohol dehydrogenase family)